MRTVALCTAISLVWILSCDVDREPVGPAPDEIKTEKEVLQSKDSEDFLPLIVFLASMRVKAAEKYVPAQVQLLWPPEGMAQAVQPLDLTWKRVSRSVGYRVQVAGEASFADPTIDVVTEKTVLYLKGAGGPLFWRVRAKAKVKEGPWSEVRSFSFGP